jgi:peptidyl-prolyl cis-trans isomerase B (cyclophilin B)
VTPKDRERAYEKRRYEEWQTRLAEKRAHNRKIRQRLAIGGGSVVVVLVIVAAFLLVSQRGDDDDATTTASSTPSASASAAASPAATSTAKSTCPTVDVKAPATPKTYSKAPAKTLAAGRTWTWTLKTTCGDITIDLDGAKAPQAVSAMIQLTKDGYFDGTPCHRLTTSGIYVLQCGDPTGTGTGTPGYSYGPLENVPSDAVYPAGTVAMARGEAEDSQGSQFFLVYKDSTIGQAGTGGYSVIGKMSAKGLDVVTKVAKGGTVSTGDGAPNSAVSIRTASVKG